MMPVLFPLGNYFFIGPRYFQEAGTFVAGTLVVFGLYWLSIVALTLAVRRIITQLPAMPQTWQRLLTMLVVVGSLTAGLAIFDVWVYSLVPATGVQFSWQAVQPVWVLGGVFDILLCTALGMFYAAEQWKQNHTETERLQQQALQQQLDALKGQVNPHFLFNSLSSISALIGEDNQQAERFVDHLSNVYRYLLQASHRDLVPLTDELQFARNYAELLQVRYGNRLRVHLPAVPTNPAASRDGSQNGAGLAVSGQLPPLSLQTLIDNAIKHNAMLPGSPLLITIELTPFGQLQVINNRQRRTRLIDTQQNGLANLIAKYHLLSERPVLVEATASSFAVTLPLLPAAMPS